MSLIAEVRYRCPIQKMLCCSVIKNGSAIYLATGLLLRSGTGNSDTVLAGLLLVILWGELDLLDVAVMIQQRHALTSTI